MDKFLSIILSVLLVLGLIFSTKNVFNNKDTSQYEIEKLFHEKYEVLTFLSPSCKTLSNCNDYTRNNINNTNAKYKYGDYIRENAMGKESEPKLLPNFSGPIHVMLLQ
ncbi:hypothetical protein Y919_11455 [Caloranaerobacter azorensis H53214]|uniref:Uncharacterized protein n=1 Tax=Caloranaerobacter azorensis H53214 TaxID=1156417 RepID=A0A096BEH8_9FIRM|nr:hypothetical protein [Caloranaerobacter azorensis]KGG79530.1 hypothetical protein Y919_11455 [Caloranaerobacter azorensis H53214]